MLHQKREHYRYHLSSTNPSLKALESESFIKVTEEEVVKLEEIIIDKTGLSKIIGADKFLEILNSKKHRKHSANPVFPPLKVLSSFARI